MALVDPFDQCYSFDTRKKIGKSGQYGRRIYGEMDHGGIEPVLGPRQYGVFAYGEERFGNASSRWGIYQRRYSNTKPVLSKGEFYYPKNPRTEAQQAQRAKMTDGVLAWQNLTNEQKSGYNESAKRKKMTGFNLFLRQYLLSH